MTPIATPVPSTATPVVEDELANQLFEKHFGFCLQPRELTILPTRPTYVNILETFPIKLRPMMDHPIVEHFKMGTLLDERLMSQGATLIISKSMAVQEAQTCPGKLW